SLAANFVCLSNDAPTTYLLTLSLHDALPILDPGVDPDVLSAFPSVAQDGGLGDVERLLDRVELAQQIHLFRRIVACSEVQQTLRSEEHTSELQSRENLVCRLLLEKKMQQ